MDASDERLINTAVSDALGGVGQTAFDRIQEPLRAVARDRYHAKLSERHTASRSSLPRPIV